MVISVLEMVLPIVITFSLGVMARKKALFDDNGCRTLKTIVSRILLPIVLLNAFLFADYSTETIIIIVVVLIAMIAVLGLAYLIRRFVPDRAKYFPFVFSTLECGSIGYPLINMLYGARGTSDMAIIDVGHTIFLFMIAIPILQIADTGSADVKKIMKDALTSATFLAMVVGIILGVLGVDTAIANSPYNGIYNAVISFLTAPTAMLILLSLGYDISLRDDLMKPVLFTSLSRLVTMAVFCAVSCPIIFHFMPYSKPTLVALMLAYSLPASFAIPAFGKFEGHKDYVSTTISFSTVLTLIIFVFLAIFAKS